MVKSKNDLIEEVNKLEIAKRSLEREMGPFKEVHNLVQRKHGLETQISVLKESGNKVIAEAQLKASGILETASSNIQSLQSELGQKQAKLNTDRESLKGREKSVSLLEDEKEEVRLIRMHLQAKDKEFQIELEKVKDSQIKLFSGQESLDSQKAEVAKKMDEIGSKVLSLASRETALNATLGDLENDKKKSSLALSDAKNRLEQLNQQEKELSLRASIISDKESYFAIKDQEMTYKESKLNEVIGQVEMDKRRITQEFSRINNEKSLLAQQRLGLAKGVPNVAYEGK